MSFRQLILLGALALGFAGCTPESSTMGGGQETEVIMPPERSCGTPLLTSVRGDEGQDLGVFEVSNDTHRLWISYSHTPRYVLKEARIYAGVKSEMPLTEDGEPNPAEFELLIRQENSPGRWFLPIGLEELPECVALSARIELEDQEPQNGQNIVRGWAYGNSGSSRLALNYCPFPCIPENACESAVAGDFTTLSPAEWEDEQDEWREILTSDFRKAFPGGLELGCNRYLKLRSPESVLKFFGQSGPPASLESSYVDPPVRAIKNDLANELCALELNMGMDRALENFSSSKGLLEGLVIKSGAFKGWKVEELCQEGNVILGACASNYSAAQITEVLQRVNSNFSRGTEDGGYLACPSDDI